MALAWGEQLVYDCLVRIAFGLSAQQHDLPLRMRSAVVQGNQYLLYAQAIPLFDGA